jgi:hypothetical protein
MTVEIEIRPTGIFLAGTDVAVPCQWFARCDRNATTITPHPVLGDVPTCQRCADLATN